MIKMRLGENGGIGTWLPAALASTIICSQLAFCQAPSVADTGSEAATPSSPQAQYDKTPEPPPEYLKPLEEPFTPKTPLKGTAEYKLIEAAGGPVTSRLINTCRATHFRCVNVRVKNTGQDTIVLDGEHAVSETTSGTLRAATAQEIAKNSGCKYSLFATALLLAGTVGTGGLAGPMLVEVLDRPRDRYMPFGIDAVRWEIYRERFGRRLLFPGDETSGWVCFRCGGRSVADNVHIPVFTVGGRVSGKIVVQLAAATEKSDR